MADYVPNVDTSDISFKRYWNSAVFYTFDFLIDSPNKIASVSNYVVDNVSSLMAEESKSSES